MDAEIPGDLAAETTAAGSSFCFCSAEDAETLFVVHPAQIMDADVAAAADYCSHKKELVHMHQPFLCL